MPLALNPLSVILRAYPCVAMASNYDDASQLAEIKIESDDAEIQIVEKLRKQGHSRLEKKLAHRLIMQGCLKSWWTEC